MINELMKQCSELKPGKGQFKVGNSTVTYNITDHGYHVSIVSGSDLDVDKKEKVNTTKETIDKMVKEFTKEVESLTDDVFIKTCEDFDKFQPISINQLTQLFEAGTDLLKVTNGIKAFKKQANEVIRAEISNLEKQMFKI